MQIKPNETKLRGEITAIQPRPDGWGADVTFHVHENLSASHDVDFLRPECGASLKLFLADTTAAKPGDIVEVKASLLGGPSGEQSIIESISSLSSRDGELGVKTP